MASIDTSALPPEMRRAFLSHATADKPFVEAVATRLGRQRVLLDKWTFETGVAFIAAIRDAMAKSGVFVLFASRASLASLWVKFEIDEAEELLRAEVLKTAIVLIVDPLVHHSDLPKWMQKSLVETASSPAAAARQIEYHLNRLRGLEPNPLFLGRDELLAELSDKLIPAPEQVPPHIVLVSGLSGVGRRTFLRRAFSDFLSVRVGPIFHLRPTDGIDILHLKLLDELGALDTKENLALAIKKFQSSTLTDKAQLLAHMLASAGVDNVAPVILDDGGLMDASGGYTEDMIAVLEALRAYPNLLLGIVHSKRPAMPEHRLTDYGAVFVRVPPLDLTATKLLLTQTLRRNKVVANSDQISELSPYLDGYPPAINLAVSIARQYGLSIVLADKSGLVDYKIRTFAGVLDQLQPNSEQWRLLRFLAAEFSLTLAGLAAMVGQSEDAVAGNLRGLIDWNLVIASGNLFTIASPVRAAVLSIKGTLGPDDFTAIARSLKATFWDGMTQLPPVEVIDSTIHAVLRSSSPDLKDFEAFVVPSVLYRVAKEYYDRGGQDAWASARKVIDQLSKLAPADRRALVLKAKTQIRLTEWKEARATISEIEQLHYPEHHYLMGFLLWKKRSFSQAIVYFRRALNAGQDSMEIYHGLAWCQVRVGDLPEAEKTIKRSLRGRRPNSLLVDLAAYIAIVQQKWPEAEDYIDQLRRIRAFDDHAFRLGMMLNARKQYANALPLIEAAAKGSRRRFEVSAALVDTLIEVQQFGRAASLLRDLDQNQRQGRDREAVRLGLRCKLYLRQGRWQQAEEVWRTLPDKMSSIHGAYRAEILRQQIDDVRTSPGARAAAEAELKELRTEDLDLLSQLDLEPEIESEDEPSSESA